MIRSTMQDYPLTIGAIMRHGAGCTAPASA
jgi:hypothetical protein